MATFSFDGIDLYYEDHGSGDPLLILNGIFMSCASWAPFVETFSRDNRLLLLDLVDQGRSGRVDHEYTQELQERAVVAFLDHLGLDRAHLCGISYGGEVAMRVASRHPGRVDSLVLANTTAWTSPWLTDIGHAWEHAMSSHDGHVFFATCIPIVYSPGFYAANHAWLAAREEMFVDVFTPETYDAFARLTRSAERHDERDRLSAITAPTLVLSSEHDHVTPLPNQTELVAGISGAAHIVIQGSGHASMYEKPAEFTATVLGFVNHPATDITIT